jgi:hypothetical protein
MAPIVKKLKQLISKYPPNYFPARFKLVMNQWLDKTED